MKKRYLLSLLLLTTTSVGLVTETKKATALPRLNTPEVVSFDPFKDVRDERDRARRRAEEKARQLREQRDRARRRAEERARQIREQRDRARRQAEEAARKAREARDRVNRSIQEGQKNLRELEDFQRNPRGYIKSKISQYGPRVGYHRTNKGEIKSKLKQGGWQVIYSKEFGGDEWAKLTACLAGDVVGGGGSCTTSFVQNYVRQSYYKVARGIKNEGVQARKSFRKYLTKKNFAKLMIDSIRYGGVQTPQVRGIDVQFGNATYNRRECLVKELGGYCVKLPNSHQPYIRYRVRFR